MPNASAISSSGLSARYVESATIAIGADPPSPSSSSPAARIRSDTANPTVPSRLALRAAGWLMARRPYHTYD